MVNDEGFTLIEMMVTLSILTALSLIALAAFQSSQGRAQDRVVQSELRTAVLVEEIYHQANGIYTADEAKLLALEPSLSFFSGDPVETVQISLQLAQAADEVCLFSQSKSGTWFGVYRNATEGTRFGKSPPAGCDPDALGFTADGW
jgi:prepilin-type N-terminal cleavage/methylation domain-containing protein